MDLPRLPGIAFILLFAAAAADTMAQEQDSPGTADHPLVSRYAGSFIDGQEVLDFTDYTLPVGPPVLATWRRLPPMIPRQAERKTGEWSWLNSSAQTAHSAQFSH